MTAVKDIQPEWLEGVTTIALTAGASAPECLVEEVVEFLAHQGIQQSQEVEVMPENVRFGLPPEIVEAIAAAPLCRRNCRRRVFIDGMDDLFDQFRPRRRLNCVSERSTTSPAVWPPPIDAARNWLFSQQHEDGYWCGELEADTTLESDYILLHTLLGTGNPERFRKVRQLHPASSE